MTDLNKISQATIEKIASNYKIDVSIIKEVVYQMEKYLDIYYESFKEFKSLPFPKYDELPWSLDPIGWANLSLFYHNNKKEIELPQPKIFKKADLSSSKDNREHLRLSEFVINHIVKTYLEKMANENLLFDQHTAEKILSHDKRMGKRNHNETGKRNELVKLAATTLKRNGIKNYAPILQSIFTQIGYPVLSAKTIRVIVSRPSK